MDVSFSFVISYFMLNTSPVKFNLTLPVFVFFPACFQSSPVFSLCIKVFVFRCLPDLCVRALVSCGSLVCFQLCIRSFYWILFCFLSPFVF